jgi:hypothetical protein
MASTAHERADGPAYGADLAPTLRFVMMLTIPKIGLDMEDSAHGCSSGIRPLDTRKPPQHKAHSRADASLSYCLGCSLQFTARQRDGLLYDPMLPSLCTGQHMRIVPVWRAANGHEGDIVTRQSGFHSRAHGDGEAQFVSALCRALIRAARDRTYVDPMRSRRLDMSCSGSPKTNDADFHALFSFGVVDQLS